MDYYNLTWILMVGSVIGTILVIQLRMVSGTFLNLITSIGWTLYYYHIEQYPAVILLGIFSFLYLYGLIKHTRILLKATDGQEVQELQEIDV